MEHKEQSIEYYHSGIKFSQIEKYILFTNPRHTLMHTNDHYEIYISHTQKPIYYYLDQQLFRLSAGDIVITPPGVRHCAFLEPGDVLSRTKIGIDEDVLRRFEDFHDLFALQTPVIVRLQTGNYQTCLEMLRKMENYIRSPGQTGVCRMILDSLSFFLFLQECICDLPQAESVKYPRLLQEILSWIQEENRYLTLTGNREIAAHFHISENYIPRLFQLYYPMPLKTLILHLKIQYATEQLSNGATVAEACYASGFSDCSHFIATFKRITGTTPGKYKNKR